MGDAGRSPDRSTRGRFVDGEETMEIKWTNRSVGPIIRRTLSPPMETSPVPALSTALRVLGLVVLALMLGSILYAGWISAVNWNAIGV